MSDRHDPDTAAMFALGADIASIIEDAEHTVRHADQYGDPRLAATLAVVLRELMAAGDSSTLIAAVEAYEKADAEWKRRSGEQRARENAAYAEAVRRHNIAKKVECPYCSAKVDEVCRTVGGDGRQTPKGIHDHADRLRLAQKTLGEV